MSACEWFSRRFDDKGQMTVELVLLLPVALIIAVIAVNALVFFGYCAEFDHVARNATRVYACSPANGQGLGETIALVEGAIEEELDADNVEVSVRAEAMSMGNVRVIAEISYAPTLFSMGLKSEVFGVSLPRLRHETTMVVDSYVPGDWF